MLNKNFSLGCIDLASRMIVLESKTLILSFLFHILSSYSGLDGHCLVGLEGDKIGFERAS